MELNQLFTIHPGNTPVGFDVVEIEKIKKLVETPLESESIVDLETQDTDEEQTKTITEEIEEFKVVTKLTMDSRKLKVDINPQFLSELEQLQIKFKVS